MKKFATLLDDYIEASGMKQTRIAAAAHISYNYLLRLLAGDRRPSESVVLKIAEAMRLSGEQTSELLAAAGFAPSPNLLSEYEQALPQAPLKELSEATRFIQQFTRLAQEIPDALQEAFLDEMKYFLHYARYKYILSGGANLLDLNAKSLSATTIPPIPSPGRNEQMYLNLLAQIIGALSSEEDQKEPLFSDESLQGTKERDEALPGKGAASASRSVKGPSEKYQPEFVRKVFTIIQEGASWDIRYHITKALPSFCQLDVPGTEQLMSVLRLDTDDIQGADIRRRVLEALPSLFEASPQSLPTVVRLLHPVAEDDIYVALATVEVCGDIHTKMKQMLETPPHRKRSREKALEAEHIGTLIKKYQPEISRIQRLLLSSWDGGEHESIQFSITLHDLLSAPDTLLLSLNDGLASPNKLSQFVATRYLERLLLVKPGETLELYRLLLERNTIHNVRRSVARALPTLLRCLEETSLSTRTLARTVIGMLATDADIYIRRAVADHAMQLLSSDRDFLMVLLRTMHTDRDQTVRLRLQPVALGLAQFWLSGYAETAGLIAAKPLRPQKSVALDEKEVP